MSSWSCVDTDHVVADRSFGGVDIRLPKAFDCTAIISSLEA